MPDAEKEVRDGQRFLSESNFDKAITKFKKAIKLDPKNAEAHFGFAEASLGNPKAKPEKILEAYKKAIELDPENSYYLSTYGSFCIDLGRFNDAEKSFIKAAEVDEDNSRRYYADFAIDYAIAAPQVMGAMVDELDEKTLSIIKKKALTYMLKSIGVSEDEAINLLKQK